MRARVPQQLWIVLAVSTVLRVGAALYLGDHIRDLPGIADQRSYHELANRVREGHGFSFAVGWWPATPAGQPTAHWSFLYVLLLAGIYELAGPHPLVVRLAQTIAVGLLHPYLTWRIGRRVLDERAALPAAAASAVYAYFVYYSAAVMTEALYILAVLWAIDLACSVIESERDHGRLATWVAMGLAISIAVLFRQMFALCVPFIFGWTAHAVLRRSARAGRAIIPVARGMLAATFVVVVCVAPWTIRNYRAFGDLVPLNTNSGFAVFWGNHPVHGYHFKPLLEPAEYGALIPDELRPLNEGRLDRALLVRGLQFIKDDPARYAALTAGRLVEYVKFWPTSDSSPSSNLARLFSFGLAAPLMLAGLTLTFAHRVDLREPRRPAAMLLVIVALVHSAIYVLTWTLVRYRLPVDALLMPFAASALVSLADRVRAWPGVGAIARNAES